ncbi:AMSH-like ubiquitin thioesterase 2 isoform X1 [Nicotiana tabacum]|uniref:AMSH-like ubiquitin thioesterase 2 isoform X1 n=2 Tax=Nicotiana TaxID=4085 RepID=A0A1S4C0Q6_TOBAC|nr:PREDICTED: AMSH-like ubiquitin thioesterase 2 isoform X2 [Nicotiana sylvestris]XP_016494658.1 PREDICTED: AMSH-like ubiquitin thioesterase 2 isoform X1 [Nicotiana tabacum]XP_016494659.1 PREDICTED: AMSH-like ubiquitin thioesterase 2 isoform X1 [Nicotiana tabacum]
MAGGVCCQTNVHTVSQTAPSPGISLIHTLPDGAEISSVSTTDSSSGPSNYSRNVLAASGPLKDVHVPTRLMENFLEIASNNTKKDIETCGVLGAILKDGTFYITSLIIPKQESTSNSCQALQEEEMFAILHEQSLFPIGWIHSCFMSSIDLHTQYSYQVMVPEAIGIVMAPIDKSRAYGIFRLSDGGMKILKDCPEKGFHLHKEPVDGSPLYEDCSSVYINSCLRLEIFDLR